MIRLTQKQIKTRLVQLEADFPKIQRIVTEEDCAGCRETRFADEYGWEWADAMREYETLAWLGGYK